MPPKVKITKEEITKTAIQLVKAKGMQSLNARAIAKALNCSTQPIFSNFNGMEELQEATLNCAYELYLDFLRSEAESGKYPHYKAFGMAYIRFAKEEKELFKLLFMRDREGCELAPSQDFTSSIELIMKNNAISKEKAELLHLEMWSCVHGIAVMFATSFLSLDWDLISNILTDVYQGTRAIHLLENK